MVWQPMPPPTSVPSGAAMEELCGQPEQKNGARWAIGSRRGGRPRSSRPRWARRSRCAVRASAAGRPRPGRRGPRRDRSSTGTRALTCSSRLPTMRGAAARRYRTSLTASRRTGPSPRRPGSRRGRSRTRQRFVVQRPDHSELEDRTPRAPAPPRRGRGCATHREVVVGLAGGYDAEPGVARAPRCGRAVLAGVGEREVPAHPEQVRSSSSEAGGSRLPFGTCPYPRSGTTGETRPGATSAVPTASATLVTILKPAHSPEAREQA